MITALDAKVVIRIIASLALLVAVLFVAISSPSSAWDLLCKLLLISGLLSLVVVPLAVPSIFRFLHRWTGAKYWWFPLLDGVWEGRIESNWPLVRAMWSASKGERESFDPLKDTLRPEDQDPPIKVRATISSSLLTVTLRMEMLGTQRTSASILMKLDRDEQGLPRLRYLYRQKDAALMLAPTDSDEHLGSAELVLNKEGTELSGCYWTARMVGRGLNTAGKLQLFRVSGLG